MKNRNDTEMTNGGRPVDPDKKMNFISLPDKTGMNGTYADAAETLKQAAAKGHGFIFISTTDEGLQGMGMINITIPQAAAGICTLSDAVPPVLTSIKAAMDAGLV